jgi:hypothetical protein
MKSAGWKLSQRVERADGHVELSFERKKLSCAEVTP